MGREARTTFSTRQTGFVQQPAVSSQQLAVENPATSCRQPATSWPSPVDLVGPETADLVFLAMPGLESEARGGPPCAEHTGDASALQWLCCSKLLLQPGSPCLAARVTTAKAGFARARALRRCCPRGPHQLTRARRQDSSERSQEETSSFVESGRWRRC